MDDEAWEELPPPLPKSITIPNPYERNYRMKDDFDFPRNLAQIIYEETGCVLPRNLHVYDGMAKLLGKYGIRGKDAAAALMLMSTLGMNRRSAEALNFDADLDFEHDEMEAGPREKTEKKENQTVSLEELRAKNKRLKAALHAADKENRDTKKKMASLKTTADREHRELSDASAFADSTNVFMPYYRQAGMPVMKKAWKETGNCEAAISGMPYGDIAAALDYYFEYYNGGRTFIIAGHSQGSCMTKFVLKNYFKEHPKYYARMVAAYVIGYSVTKDELAAYPYLKFATGETDTGVIISYNTEGPKNAEQNVETAVLLPNAISINLLNWKLDETYAPANLNLGSLVPNEKTGELEIKDVGADAQINLARGVVVTNAKVPPMPEDFAKVAVEFFGPDCRHGEDYTFYYNNIKANVAKRVAAYLANK